jgi:hypothetical protein
MKGEVKLNPNRGTFLTMINNSSTRAATTNIYRVTHPYR